MAPPSPEESHCVEPPAPLFLPPHSPGGRRLSRTADLPPLPPSVSNRNSSSPLRLRDRAFCCRRALFKDNLKKEDVQFSCQACGCVSASVCVCVSSRSCLRVPELLILLFNEEKWSIFLQSRDVPDLNTTDQNLQGLNISHYRELLLQCPFKTQGGAHIQPQKC